MTKNIKRETKMAVFCMIITQLTGMIVIPNYHYTGDLNYRYFFFSGFSGFPYMSIGFWIPPR
jgi:hypothetical protein